jgi:hypothetical protein
LNPCGRPEARSRRHTAPPFSGGERQKRRAEQEVVKTFFLRSNPARVLSRRSVCPKTNAVRRGARCERRCQSTLEEKRVVKRAMTRKKLRPIDS